jgi:ribosomal quality control pathway NFACT family protein/fibronectin-binding protein A (FbpA)
MMGPLVGGQVQRLAVWRLGRREVALLKVRISPRADDASPGENVHVVVATGMGVGVVDKDGRARLREAMLDAASPAQGLWRARLEGGRVLGAREGGLAIVCEGRRWYASAEGAGALTLAEPAAQEGKQGEPEGKGEGEGKEPDREALTARGTGIVEALVRGGIDGRCEALRRALAKAIARLARRIDAIRGDLARMQGADAQAERARLFVAQAAKAPRGATKLEAVDWSSGEAETIEIVLDPARGAKEQLDALFKRARRLKEGAQISRARLQSAENAHAALAGVAGALAEQKGVDLDALEANARAAAPRDFRLDRADPAALSRAMPREPRDQAPLPPYRTFVGVSGARILVGRGAEHNDALTFRVARPHDLWLHAKNWTGAHVIVPRDKVGSCPAEVLVEAAHLAAHFSSARDERVVEVEYTPRRYVRKPRGSAPGLVVVDREKVIVLRREDPLLTGLLEREAKG